MSETISESMSEAISESRKMIAVDSGTMRAVAPHLSGEPAQHQADIIAAVGPLLQPTLADYSINTRLRIAHFLGQTCQESAGFSTTVEFGSGEEYEGRTDLGNTHPGDGPRYKGRGLIQLTGRANYREYGQALHIDLEGHPERAAEPALSLRIACEYWKRRNINPACDRDDIEAVTKLINGGLNGLVARRTFTDKAKAVLGGSGEDHPVLQQGAQGAAVKRLQSLLRSQGSPDLAVDGDFGPATEAAVKHFQSSHKLTVDGIVGPQTWAALEASAH